MAGRSIRSLGVTYERANVKYLAAAAAYIATLWFTFIVVVFGLISLIGPHSKPVPESMSWLVYVMAVLALLIVPALAARAAFRAGSKKEDARRFRTNENVRGKSDA